MTYSRDFADKKYTVTHNNGQDFRALRHGEPWQFLTGNGLVLAMVQEVERLDAEIADLKLQLKNKPDATKAFLENWASTAGWDSSSGEGAFEYIQRKSYAQGHEDGRVEALNGGRRP